jgi:tetratricopeptide (TPR) repeat protein
MVEIYRDRLKLDVMVVNAFNQILNIQPGNLAGAEALAAQYEQMKRWPDLISLLRKKAAVVEDHRREGRACHLRVANLFLEKFSNQAEAIKAFETVLELDPEHTQALAFLKQMYEKRRDWEKLIAVHQREIAKLTETGGAEGAPHRGREAGLREAEEAVGLHRTVAPGAGGRSCEPRGARRAREALRAREGVDELGDGPAAQVNLQRGRRRPSIGAAGQAGDSVHGEGQRAREGHRRLAGAAGQTEPENRRAQDALKKLYLQQRDWNALEQFYAAQGKWDELVRVLERQTETEEEPARLGLWNKIGEIYRDRLSEGRQARRRPSRRRCPSTRRTWSRPRR